jgi:replicative DNA helicase
MSVTELTPRDGEFERTPPHDLAAEQCVLGGMLMSKDAISDVMEVIRPPDHYRPAHQLVHEAILELYGRGEPADPVTVSDLLAKRGELARIGGGAYLHTLLASVPTAANAGYYARIVRERAILRRLVEAGTRIVQLGYTGDGDADELVDRAEAEIYGVTDRRVSEDFLPLSEIMPGALDEIEAIGSRGGGMTGVPTGFSSLDSLTNGLHPGQMIVIAARPAIGKALAFDTPLPTPAGWTTMGEVAVGERLLGADGRPVTVVAATEAMHGRPCYEVEFSDGEVIVADAQHQWLTWTRRARRYDAQLRGHSREVAHPVPPEVVTTEQIARTLRCHTVDNRPNHAVPAPRALELPDADLPIPPYALGIWAGDGTSADARFTTVDPEIVMNVEASGLEVVRQGTRHLYRLAFPASEAPVPHRLCIVCGRKFWPQNEQVRTCGRTCGGKARFCSPPAPVVRCKRCGGPATGQLPSSGLCTSCWKSYGTVQAVLRTLGVLNNKHLPSLYLRGSEAQRRALLAGVLDTDGTVTSTGSVQLAVTNRRLAEDVRELVLSLGYRCSMDTKRVKGRSEASSTCYMVNFTTPDEVFRLPRKQLLHKERLRHNSQRTRWRYIVDVRPVPSRPVRCVQVDSADQLYLAGRSMIPTHNSTLALDLARAASVRHGQATVMFSLEMSRNEITMRLLSAEARVALHHMRTGQLGEDDWTRLARRMSEVVDAPLFIDDSPNMSMMEIRAKCRRLKQRHSLRLVIIDYLQLMSSSRRVENRQQEVSEMSRSLKLLAKELDVPVVAVSQLNRGPEQRNDKRPLLSDLRESGCLTAGTRILRADTGAEVTLGSLLASGERDIPVWSLDERLRLVPRILTHAFPSGTKEVYRVLLTSGREVHATANHPFLTYDGWLPLGELTVGSRVAVPRQIPEPLASVVWPEPEVIMLAQLIGDGSFVKNQPIRYASVDEANLAAVTEAARHFGITAIRDVHAAARCISLRLPAPYHLTHRKRNPIAAWLDSMGLFGLRSHEKFIPSGVFSLPGDQLALFLRHLWSTDGSVTVSKSGVVRIYYGTSSERLARDLQVLLLRFDIRARLRAVGNTYGHPQWTLDIRGVDQQQRFLTEIRVHGDRMAQVELALAQLESITSKERFDTIPTGVWERVQNAMDDRGVGLALLRARVGTASSGDLNARISPSRKRLRRIAEALNDAELDMLATNDVYWDAVKAIESTGENPVYDATVLGSHNFVANGISLHNSIEQDSDMVILLHREDAYEPESPRAGEADLIVAKHRNGPTAVVTVAFQGHYSRFVDMAPG